MARAPEAEGRSFRYQPRSKEDLKERANARGGGFDTFVKSKYKLYKVRDGKNLIRVLPPTWKQPKHYGYDIWVNYSIGVDNQSYLSLAKMLDEKDPLLEARRQAERDGDKKLAAALQPRQRILMWVIDRQDEDEGPQLWAAPFTVDKALANISFDEDTKEVIFIDNPKTGCDVRFYKEGSGLKTKYPAEKMRLLKPSRLHEDADVQADWLEFVQANAVPDCLQFYDYEHIDATFNGQAGRADDDDDGSEERPRNRRPTREPEDDDPPPRRRAAAEPEEDEAPPPRRRAAEPEEDDPPPRTRRAAVEPEEDEEPPPRRQRSRLADTETEDDPPPRRRPPAEDDDPPPRRRAAAPEPDEEPAGESIRDRLKRRRSGETAGRREPADPEDE